MKYDQQASDLKNQLQSARSILIALPATLTSDKLASALSLYLSLTAMGKEVSVATEDTPRVLNSNLYGIGQVQNSLPKTSGGNLTLTLEGVVASDGTVPALEKLDWYPEGQNLNLVFHVLPGQTFQPARIIPNLSGGSFNLIITVGSSSLNALGRIYSENVNTFSGVSVVNIDNDPANTQFGTINVVDSQSPSISEIVAQLISGATLSVDQDIASNLLAGIYAATSNLTVNAAGDTFTLVGQLVSFGGKLPQGDVGVASQVAPQPQIVMPVQPVAEPAPTAPILPAAFAPQPSAENWSANFAPLNQVFGFPVQQEAPKPIQNDNFTVPPVVNDQSQTPSYEERTMGEYVGSSNPEIPSNPDPDWLTPKVYKGVG